VDRVQDRYGGHRSTATTSGVQRLHLRAFDCQRGPAIHFNRQRVIDPIQLSADSMHARCGSSAARLAHGGTCRCQFCGKTGTTTTQERVGLSAFPAHISGRAAISAMTAAGNMPAGSGGGIVRARYSTSFMKTAIWRRTARALRVPPGADKL